MGNVYSAYYNYYLDFGYWGILCAGVMSLVLAIVYRKMLKSQFWKTGKLDWGIIFYSWLIPFCFMCFFANQFWGYFSIEGVIKNLLWWWLILYYIQGKEGNQWNSDVELQNQDYTSVENVNPNEV